jgi:hypothetical protein
MENLVQKVLDLSPVSYLTTDSEFLVFERCWEVDLSWKRENPSLINRLRELLMMRSWDVSINQREPGMGYSASAMRDYYSVGQKRIIHQHHAKYDKCLTRCVLDLWVSCMQETGS